MRLIRPASRPRHVAAGDAPSLPRTSRRSSWSPATASSSRRRSRCPPASASRIEVANQNAKAIEFESKDLKQEKVIAPGKSAVITLNALKPGEYRYFDEFQQSTGQGKIVAK